MTRVLAARVDEDLALIEEMLALVPEGSSEWRPPWADGFSVGELAGHLAESCGGICGCLARLRPSLAWTRAEPAEFKESLRVIAAYRGLTREGFALVEDGDLMRVIPSYFVPDGEPFLALLLVNLKHVNHHAHQLFVYLRLMGVPVGTRQLYRFK
jgi:hypothetical protein